MSYTKIKRLCIIISLIIILTLPGCNAKPEQNEPVSSVTADTFSFIFMSDTQADPEEEDYSEFGRLLDNALAHETKPELLILGGDSINDGGSQTEWDLFFAAAGNLLDDITIASVAGNHDNNPLLSEQFDYPSQVPSRVDEGYFYSFVYKDIFFLMLDSNIMGAGNSKDALWVEKQLASEAAQNSCWRIAVCHHPFWPAANIPKDVSRAETMQRVFLPVLESGSVDLILCGHQHMYARTEPLESRSGIVQIMLASGGKDSYTPKEIDSLAAYSPLSVYLLVDVDPYALRLFTYDSNGETVDQTIITKR